MPAHNKPMLASTDFSSATGKVKLVYLSLSTRHKTTSMPVHEAER